MIHQLDIKNAFLHGDLEKEVYMEQPPGFVAQGEYGKVCYLKKALYGLKQSPRAWFGKFSKEIQAFGMNKSKKDHSIFYKKSAAGIILLVVYVDDIQEMIMQESLILRHSCIPSFIQRTWVK